MELILKQNFLKRCDEGYWVSNSKEHAKKNN